MAVFTLPAEMIGFYKYYLEYITEHAVDPDKRRYAVEKEAEKHYIDIDNFASDSLSAFEEVPQRWSEAVEKFSEDTLRAYGIVPWQIQWDVMNLTKAFEERDVERILYLSANLGHYVADAHVPLHTTVNYNGQLTGQKGIHGLWESRIPELKAEEYDYLIGKAEYVKNPMKFTWEIVKESHSLVDSVLGIEKTLSLDFPSDQKYVFESRGQSTVKQYSREYAMEYHLLMNGMVESQMRKAISALGSLWYTAWVNAGQPQLDKLLNNSGLDKLEKKGAVLDKEYSTGKEKGRIHDESD